MNGRNKVIPYPQERALEDAMFGRGLVPTRIFPLLLPVWEVEVKATVTDGRPYQLIDRYLERGIAEGGLGTRAELAGFFALDVSLVDRAVRVLGAIGHLTEHDGRLALTELGRRSQRDQVCYLIEREDRRKLYFDGFLSRPLTRPYYQASVVTLMSQPEARAATVANAYPRFGMLWTATGFRREALTELANQKDRDRYNLPTRIENPESVGEQLVHLPLYVVRATDRQRRVHHLAYSQVGDTADPELSELCELSPEINGVLNSEEIAAKPNVQETHVHNWLKGKNLGGFRPEPLADGDWRITLPANAFDPGGPVPPSKLGSYVVLSSCLLRVDCDDEETRKRTLLTRVENYLAGRSRVTAADVEARIDRVARQLRLSADMRSVREMASGDGRSGFARRLSGLLDGTLE
ncbi:hypothetical protein [Amycolatopsis sp. CA-230715]|uniref:hypothetical protein n=1 Tax=Amycolatopsis sp. CA-230715 TaxID=2745196 RepID=UPI001C012B49|nr:hypothetical protein [Amycolatopsis sp. CA-230715]QWF83012.1 hypothetical protein HUW46_06451 [Amycolatopsis sp. CA-230715]